MSTQQRSKAFGLLVLLNILLLAVVIFQWSGGGSNRSDDLARPVGDLLSPAAYAQAPSLQSPAGKTPQLPGWERGFPDMAAATEKISQSIVSIGAVRTVVQRTWARDYFSPFYMPYDIAEHQRIPYLGSGVIVSKDGIVITNHHVIEDAEELFVTLPNGEEVTAKLVDADKVLDIAIVKLDHENCVPAELADSETLRAGQWALAVGNPFGNLIGDPQPTVTVGVISALNRSFSPEQGRHRVYSKMIQTDAAINPGNSGGPLIDAEGRVIGINTFIFTQSGGSNGIGFAIPINRAKKVWEEVRQYGKVRDLYPDFKVSDITPRQARYLGLKSTRGVIVNQMEKDGPAAKAGVNVGDVILAVDGQPCSSIEWFWPLFAAHHVGDKLRFTILRDGETKTVYYTIQEGN